MDQVMCKAEELQLCCVPCCCSLSLLIIAEVVTQQTILKQHRLEQLVIGAPGAGAGELCNDGPSWLARRHL